MASYCGSLALQRISGRGVLIQLDMYEVRWVGVRSLREGSTVVTQLGFENCTNINSRTETKINAACSGPPVRFLRLRQVLGIRHSLVECLRGIRWSN